MPALDKRTVTITVVLVAVLLVGLGFFFFFRSSNQQPQLVHTSTLEIWTPLDRREQLEPLWSSVTDSMGIKTVKFQQIAMKDYEAKLIDALAAGTGPDIFFIKNTWLGRYFNKIIPASDPQFYSLSSLDTNFVEVIKDDVYLGEKIWGLPLFLDTLAILYNRDFFNAQGIAAPPKTWEEFKEYAQVLTRYDSQGNIIRSGAALGTSRNIENFKDIIAMFMMQNGAELTNAQRNDVRFNSSVYVQGQGFVTPAIDAVNFYFSFASSSNPTWSRAFGNSLESFAQTKIAMILAYNEQIQQIKNLTPQLRFAVAPIPQFSGSQTPKSYGEFWIAVVSNKSKAPNDAWAVVKGMATSPAVYDYLKKTGRPPALRSLIPQFQTDNVLGVFTIQGLTARSWYQGDENAVESIFADMIESILDGKVKIPSAVASAASRVAAVLRQFPGSVPWQKNTGAGGGLNSLLGR